MAVFQCNSVDTEILIACHFHGSWIIIIFYFCLNHLNIWKLVLAHGMYEKQDKGCNGPTGHSLETPDVDDFSFSDIISIPSASLQWRRVVVGWGCRQDSPSSAWRWSADPGNTHIFIMLYLLHQKILCTHAHTDTYTYPHTHFKRLP